MLPQRRGRRVLAGNEEMIRWLARPGAAPAVPWRLRAGQRGCNYVGRHGVTQSHRGRRYTRGVLSRRRRLWGLAGGIYFALAWNGGCQVVRRLPGKPLSGLLFLGLLELVLRASVARPSSTQAFFHRAPHRHPRHRRRLHRIGVDPTPRVSKVLADLVPHSVLDVNDPGLAALLREGSLLDGAEQPLIAVVSLIMIVNLSITVYVAVHSLVSWVVLALMAAIVTPFLLGEVGAVDMRSWRPPVDLDLLLQSGVVMGQTPPVSSWVAPATGWPVCRACRPPGG
jgi:hypothetical protein